jgi:hypothetical protein
MHLGSTRLAILLAAVGCGGSPTPPPAPGGAGAKDAAHEEDRGARCLAEAGAAAELAADAPLRITVSHVLVKHAGAERPAGASRSREQACLRAAEALEQLKKGTSFEEVVASYSDEPGAATRAGSLGPIEPTDVDPAFAAAAFALELQQVSHVVETEFGFHVILRSE